MGQDTVVLRFDEVSFEYQSNKKLLNEVDFSVRSGSRITLMGQNGAGKSSIFKLITGEAKPTSGTISRTPGDATIALAHQVMPEEAKELTVQEFFATAFKEKQYNLDKQIKDIFEVVHLVNIPLDRKIKALSGGQQARILLSHALIQNPDILLLDEPTNNLDQQGIEHLTGFLMMYEKTVIVISHDADFLNAFSDGVLYLDAHTQEVEQYTGNYYVVVEEIKNRIERENKLNARMQAQIKEKRAKSEVFAHKGGKLRGVAKKMRESAQEAEESIVQVRREDKTIRDFTIPTQEFDMHFDGKIMQFNSVSAIKDGEIVEKKLELVMRKNRHILIAGPNGIGKTTMLEKLTEKSGEGFSIADNVLVGYYKQDFSNLDYDKTAYDTLLEVMEGPEDEHKIRATGAGFLLDGKLLASKIRALSEGQKGLLYFCRLALMNPGLLILDEPTNHINFRHLPVIAKALDSYKGALIMISHIPDFVAQIRIDEVIDLGDIK
ncbi:ATP-binding cassette domain-containing protein [Patescibacteria group bacterium]|nr:ATP-binding cassette domain-containing protein [Patescibacteria group bacterium]